MFKTSNVRKHKRTLLLVLVLSLSACAFDSQVVVPQLPPQRVRPDPALMQPPLRTDYSASAAADMKRWRETLDNSPTK